MSKTATADSAADHHIRLQFRRAGWAGAIVATLVGIFGLVFPQTALTFVALLIGVYLVVSGILRFSTAVGSRELSTGFRWLLGVIGVLLVVGGVLALNHPFSTLIALVVVLGVSWIIDGIGYVVAAITVRSSRGWWAIALAGVLLAIAGIIVLSSSLAALASLFFFFSLLLLIFGVVTIIVLGLTASGGRR